jgi:signal transduction histidine kinase/CheY-like chemotaxis protein
MRLSNRIAITASILIAAVMVIIGGMSYWTSRSQIVENAVRALEYEATIAAEAIGGRLATITGTFASLSDNTVVFNALIDSAGRETYLIPFFQGFTSINDVPIRVSLVDFQAQVLAETETTIAAPEQKAWLLKSIESGRSVGAIFEEPSGRFLIMAKMLLYPRTNTVEGVLIFKLPLENLLAPQHRGLGAERTLELAYRTAGMATEGDQPAGETERQAGSDESHLTVSLDVPVAPLLSEVGLAVKISRDKRALEAPLHRLFMTHMVIGIASTLIVLLASLWAGRRLTRPLRELESLATSIVDSESFGNRFQASGSDEINQLGVAFNHMLERLTEVYGKLKASASRLTTLVHSLPDTVFILDQAGRQIAVLMDADSGQPEESPCQARRAEAQDVLPERELLLATIRTAVESHSAQLVEYVSEVPKNRRKRSFEARVTPLPSDFGPVPAVMWVVRDVTESKRAEEALRQAQKMEAVGQLTGGVAHDFNNLLAVIMGNAEIVEHKYGSKGTPAKAIIRAASRGAELTQRLLAFSRQQPLRPHAVDLSGLIAGMTELLGRTLGETIAIKTTAPARPWKALVDPGQVENALLNLAINARDAMPSGVTLAIEAANASLRDPAEALRFEVAAGDYVMLTVTDDGTGMPPDVLSHVFEPFFTTKEVGQGSGLGLSMVYGFAKQSGGCVTIDSTEGRGTTVRLYLPRAEQPVVSAEKEHSGDVPTASGETILLVEDDPDVRQLAVTILSDLGYTVLEAGDGEGARAVLKDTPCVELLLSDVVLPGGMSGLILAEEARRRHGAIKVLFMSGYAESAVHGHDSWREDAELLNKPFRKNDLARRVRAALDGATAKPAAM